MLLILPKLTNLLMVVSSDANALATAKVPSINPVKKRLNNKSQKQFVQNEITVNKYPSMLPAKLMTNIFLRPYKSEFLPRMGDPINCPRGKIARVSPNKIRLLVSLHSGEIINWLVECKNRGGKMGYAMDDPIKLIKTMSKIIQSCFFSWVTCVCIFILGPWKSWNGQPLDS